MKAALSPPSRVGAILLVANTVLSLAFLLMASQTWIEPELANVPGASGGAGVVWFLVAVPIAVLAAILNAGVLAWSCTVRLRSGTWPAPWFSWFVVLVWVAALVFDNAHHGL